jgi:RND family efflux transporter MFP subunit
MDGGAEDECVKKAIFVLIVLVLVGLFGWKVYRKTSMPVDNSGRRRQVNAVAVEVASVQKTTIREVELFTGSLLPESYFVVAPKVGGRLEKLLVNIGEIVKQDELIAELDDEEYAQQVEQARAELEVAKANLMESRSSLDVASREFKRAQSLWKKKITSESELDSARAQYSAQQAKHKVALAQVAQKEASLRAAKVRLSYTKIRVSWENGDEARVIGERFVDEGAMLKANDPIVSVLDVQPLTAVIHVIERDYSKVKPGQEAIVMTDAFPGKTFMGRVLRVAPLLKEASRQARVEIDVSNPDGLLKPGMFVRVQIEFARHGNATVVPLGALVKRNGQQGVFVADTDQMKARFVPVTPGIVNGELAEVLSPSLSGPVVTLGHHLLEDGSAIILPDLESESSASREVDRESAPSRTKGQGGEKR